jgi:hypothetical protein
MARELVRIDGLGGVLDTLRQLPPALVSTRGGPVRVALRKAAVLIQRAAQQNVRRIVEEPNRGGRPSFSTGALEASIRVRRLRMRAGVNGEAYWVGIGKVTRKYANTKQNRRRRRVGADYEILPPTY